MLRCIELAMEGKGMTHPNPLVGSVIVHEDKIIGEGYHLKAGSPHAEVNALNSIAHEDRSLIQQSTIYINLEPCSFHGRTPACSERIIKEGIKNVVIGCEDPHPKVKGKGIHLLRKAGISVTSGILEKECQELNRFLFTYHLKKRPFILLKWAQTKDGYMGSPDNKPLKITSSSADQLVHKWRSEYMSIMVGTNTAVYDNPSLTVRNWTGKNPIRISFDYSDRIPETHHLKDQSTETWLFTSKDKLNQKNLKYFWTEKVKNPLGEILDVLHREEITSILVEGGPTLLKSFISLGMWDESRIIESDQMIHKGRRAPAIPGTRKQQIKIGEDLLTITHPFQA